MMLYTISSVIKSITIVLILCISYFNVSAQSPSFPAPSSPPSPAPSTPSPGTILIPGIPDTSEITTSRIPDTRIIPSIPSIPGNGKNPPKNGEENNTGQLKIMIELLSILEDRVSQQEQTIKELKSKGLDSLPPGTIIFYDGEDCADGWSKVTRANGRVLIGKGLYNDGADQDHYNTAYWYELKDTGGNMDFTLKESQMPRHRHGTGWGETTEGRHGNLNGKRDYLGSQGLDWDNYEYLSEPKGGGQPFDNRMPYIAYTVCKKNK